MEMAGLEEKLKGGDCLNVHCQNISKVWQTSTIFFGFQELVLFWIYCMVQYKYKIKITCYHFLLKYIFLTQAIACQSCVFIAWGKE